MDPFTEKDLIDNLRSIAASLRNIDRKLDDVALSLRELSSSGDEDDIESDAEPEKSNSEAI